MFLYAIIVILAQVQEQIVKKYTWFHEYALQNNA